MIAPGDLRPPFMQAALVEEHDLELSNIMGGFKFQVLRVNDDAAV